MFLWIHIFSWLLLVLSTILGLSRRAEKARNRYLILDRLAYLLLIVTGVYLATKTFWGAPVLTIVKGCLGIGTIGIIEVAFARQQESRLIPAIIWSTVGLILITTLVGFGLHWQLTGSLL